MAVTRQRRVNVLHSILYYLPDGKVIGWTLRVSDVGIEGVWNMRLFVGCAAELAALLSVEVPTQTNKTYRDRVAEETAAPKRRCPWFLVN